MSRQRHQQRAPRIRCSNCTAHNNSVQDMLDRKTGKRYENLCEKCRAVLIKMLDDEAATAAAAAANVSP